MKTEMIELFPEIAALAFNAMVVVGVLLAFALAR
mgnify:FL=1